MSSISSLAAADSGEVTYAEIACAFSKTMTLADRLQVLLDTVRAANKLTESREPLADFLKRLEQRQSVRDNVREERFAVNGLTLMTGYGADDPREAGPFSSGALTVAFHHRSSVTSASPEPNRCPYSPSFQERSLVRFIPPTPCNHPSPIVDDAFQQMLNKAVAHGYHTGREAGYNDGVIHGRAAGRSEGFDAGRKEGFETGSDLGFVEGQQKGMEVGRHLGFDEGIAEGMKRVRQEREE